MLDREKIIKGLEMCLIDYHDHCPDDNESECSHKLMNDALKLLEEQEPVQPVFQSIGGVPCRMMCGSCDRVITEFDYHADELLKEFKFCPWCGRELKW